MKKLEITKGEWVIIPNSLDGIKQSYDIVIEQKKGDGWGKWIADAKHPELYGGTIQESKDNAALIADAGNTYQACELLPSELLKQRNQLLEALKAFYNGVNYDAGNDVDQDTYAIAEQALKNSKP